KLREAREKGQVAHSKELTGAFLMILSFYVFKVAGEYMWRHLEVLMVSTYSEIGSDFSFGLVTTLLWQAIILFLMVMAPLFGITIGVALLVDAIQSGFLVSFEPLVPDLEKINPIEGFKKLFSMKQFVELVKTLVKMTVVFYLVYGVAREHWWLFISSQLLSVDFILAELGDMVMKLVLRIGIFYLFVGVLDYLYQRYEFLKSMRMSKKEIKEEYKRLEGDPLIKQRLRDSQRQMAQGRQMGAVPSADVVVTNPIHVAVALSYRPGEMKAPIVVAKGQRLVAAEIRRIAESHYIPVVENPPLARVIYKMTPVGGQIPPQLYRIVANILAFVYHLKKKRKKHLMSIEA
ncbi:MAG: flagellar biosynthesis protein FlhB, partial [Candidatus Margulisiibacteriota bacterium]